MRKSCYDKQPESSGQDASHLQQNYVLGFVFTNEQGECLLNLTEEWYEDFEEAGATLNQADAIREEDMQIDNRRLWNENL